MRMIVVAWQPEGLDSEADAEVDKVLQEITTDMMSGVGQVPSARLPPAQVCKLRLAALLFISMSLKFVYRAHVCRRPRMLMHRLKRRTWNSKLCKTDCTPFRSTDRPEVQIQYEYVL